MSTVDPSPVTDPAARGEPARRVRRLWLVIAATTLVVLGLAELSVRVAADRLPEPLTWYHPVAQVKVGQMAQRAAEGRGAEVVFVGTSQTAEGIDPVRFSERAPGRPATYNAAVLAGYPAVSRRFVPEQVLPVLHPQTVVFGVSPFDLEAGEEAPYDQAEATATGLLADVDRALAERSALVRYRSVLRDPAQWPRVAAGLPGEVDDVRREAVGEDGRWLLYSGRGCAVGTVQAPRDGRTEIAVDPDRDAAVRSTLRSIRSSGARPVLLTVPVPACALPEPLRARYDDGRRRLAALAAEEQVDLIDVTDQMVEDWWYQDSGHLGPEGAQRWTDLVAQSVAAQPPRGGG